MTFPLILPEIVASLAGMAALLCLVRFTRHHDWMDLGLIIPRMFICGIYIWFSIDKGLPLEITRIWSRDALALLFGAEIFYRAMCLFMDKAIRRSAP